MKRGAWVVPVIGMLGAIGPGCLTRPVQSSNPLPLGSFTAPVHDQAIDKIDLLFVVDNSASMGDKQEYLERAVPALITRLVTPNCVDPSGMNYGPSDSSGNCAKGGTVEFPPVHDMHIGVLSTALGTRLSDQYVDNTGQPGTICDPSVTVTVDGVTLNVHNDDRAELLNRAGATQSPLTDAGTSFYLNWFPANNPKNAGKSPSPGAPPISDAGRLISDFTSLVQGVGVNGCGIESQLESWYRFLVQPDPYASLALDGSKRAQWQGVDTTILKQRHDFLRPDSLVAIIDLTDEDDSEVDVRALGGKGYLWMASNWAPPRGTSSCDENAQSTGLIDATTCNSCELASGAASDPSCMMGPWNQKNEWGFDANLRHVHMTQKYGVLPQFPVERYVLGLSSPTVPDRRGEYPAGAGSYQGLSAKNQDCVNPLFAQNLPDGSGIDPNNPDLDSLCHLTRGPRTKDLVYFAHIGGVPHQLLQQDPTNPDSPTKDTLTDDDWRKILGNDPQKYDYSGIDVHMMESFQPRAGMPTSPPGDGISGYDWITDQGSGHVMAVDREYACTFPLATPRNCADPSQSSACDCPTDSGFMLTPQQVPPICDPSNPMQQIAAKTYPTARELLLARLMGDQGFVSSLCPIHVQPAPGTDEQTDPLFGYNPAVNGIVDRLRVTLDNQCLPQKLAPDACGDVQCLVLVTMPPGLDCTQPGMSTPAADILHRFQQDQHAQWLAGGSVGTDPSTLATCQLQELVQPPAGAPASCPAVGQFDAKGSCQGSSTPGWCYVEGTAAQAFHCPQAILYSNGEPPSGSTLSLQCIEQIPSAIDAGAGE